MKDTRTLLIGLAALFAFVSVVLVLFHYMFAGSYVDLESYEITKNMDTMHGNIAANSVAILLLTAYVYLE